MSVVQLGPTHPLNSDTRDAWLIAAYRGERPPMTPVWFMRQAGRSLPEYRSLRVGTRMLDACLTPELAAEITLQPVRRHGVDVAIFFSGHRGAAETGRGRGSDRARGRPGVRRARGLARRRREAARRSPGRGAGRASRELSLGHHPRGRRALGLTPELVRVPGDDGPIETAGERYERAIDDAGGVDLQVLGIGRTGHIGFNEPGSSFASLTRVKTLTQQTRIDNARFFDSVEDVPMHCITQGLGTILRARHLVLLAFGEAKAAAVVGAVEGAVTSSLPGSAIQLHRQVTVIVDEAAASGLAHADYYRYAWANRLSGAALALRPPRAAREQHVWPRADPPRAPRAAAGGRARRYRRAPVGCDRPRSRR